MIVYQVTVFVDRNCEEAWHRWMRDHHIGDVLATGYFTKADFEKSTQLKDEQATYQIRYYAETLEQYEAYARNAAASLQKDHSDRFGKSVSASRLILETFSHRD